MSRSFPSHALDKYARQLAQNWLKGKTYSTWTLEHLRQGLPSEQVVQFVLFQVDSRLLRAMYDLSLWDWQDGEMITWTAEYLSRSHARLSLPASQLTNLVSVAAYYALHLITSPQEALTQFYFGQTNDMSIKDFAFYSRYIVYFDFIPAALISYAQKHDLHHIERSLWEQKVTKALQLYQEESKEPIETYQRQLLERLTGQTWEEFGAALEQISKEKATPAEELMHNLFGTSSDSPAAAQGSDKARNPLLSAIDYEPRVMEQFQASPKRSDTLRRFDTEAIPLHKQFVFIQRVFDGDAGLFKKALEQLNTAASAEEARKLLQSWKNARTDAQAFQELERWVLSRFQS
ncbi:MAG: hypothetical protein NZ580_07165 [Bacteroidia bacterium]|nr:hypothetical protein [Bacteroidia bacterium]MDW8236362.1 hypothetical protein [Bacteroidia bacterium]